MQCGNVYGQIVQDMEMFRKRDTQLGKTSSDLQADGRGRLRECDQLPTVP